MDRQLKFGAVGDPVEFLPHERFLEARHRGTYSHEPYKKFIVCCFAACAEHGVRLLLVDITSLSGFRPSTVQRFEMGTLAASLPTHITRIAIVGTSEQIDEQFGCLVARNRGFNVQAFTAREEALRWLLGSAYSTVRQPIENRD